MLDHVKHYPLDTSGTLPLDSVKYSNMVAVMEISIDFQMQYHVQINVVSRNVQLSTQLK